ncbi:homoserine dehydrogenase [bacterium]|nr:homoserine dehydrogenase [bacterium]
MRKINIGLIGFGTVGSSVVKILKEKKDLLQRRLGAELVIKRIVDKDISTPRGIKIPPGILTRRIDDVLNDPGIDMVIELIGDSSVAERVILGAIKRGKPVVTANKALLAKKGREIFKEAEKKGVGVCFEASVGGGIPVIKALREGLAANRISSIFGIINGTANYILSGMSHYGSSFKEALKDARAKGYAERDPSLDVEGIDSAHKLTILSTLAFGGFVDLKDIHTEGITQITSQDIQYAKEFGYTIKLLAIAKESEGSLEVRVHPTMIPQEHLLAAVDGAYNAIYVRGDLIGRSMFYGRGAGGFPAASAVIADIMDLVKSEGQSLSLDFGKRPLKIKDMGEIKTRYYIRFTTVDRPGVLASISGILARHKISIASVIQKERREKGKVPIIMMSHEAKESSVQKALREIDRLKVVRAKSMLIRVEGEL